MEEQELMNIISEKFLEYSQRGELKELRLTDVAARFIFYASLLNIFKLNHTIPLLLEVAEKVEVANGPTSETVH